MKIVTAVVNNINFIEIQYYTLKKHFKGQYEFIVFNDAKAWPDNTNGGDSTIRDKISAACRSLGIQCINIPNEHHRTITKQPSDRTADSMNFITNYQRNNPDKYLLLDSDMFLISDFSIDSYSNHSSAVVHQHRGDLNYIWNGLYYFDFSSIAAVDSINWNCCEGCDTGGMMQVWLKTQKPESVYSIRHLPSCTWSAADLPSTLKENEKLVNFLNTDVRNVNGKFFCELYDGVFLHYRAGGNWRGEGMKLHTRLTEALKSAILETPRNTTIFSLIPRRTPLRGSLR